MLIDHCYLRIKRSVVGLSEAQVAMGFAGTLAGIVVLVEDIDCLDMAKELHARNLGILSKLAQTLEATKTLVLGHIHTTREVAPSSIAIMA